MGDVASRKAEIGEPVHYTIIRDQWAVNLSYKKGGEKRSAGGETEKRVFQGDGPFKPFE